MNTHETVKTVRSHATHAMLLEESSALPPTLPLRASEAPLPTRVAPQADLEDSGQWSGGILQRFEAAMTLAWRHGGLNE